MTARPIATLLLVISLMSAAVVAHAASVHAVSYDPAAVQTRVMHDYRVALQDAPAHLLRLYELRQTFTGRAPAFAGVRATDMLQQGIADTVDENGTESGYVTFLLEDGNRIYGRYAGTRKSHRWPDGSRHFDVEGDIELIGGDGAFAGARGTIHVRLILDPGAESNHGEARGEIRLDH